MKNFKYRRISYPRLSRDDERHHNQVLAVALQHQLRLASPLALGPDGPISPGILER